MSPTDETFSPDPVLPQHAEFYRRVLSEQPSPILVVDKVGDIIYANRALERMGGWDLHKDIGTNVLDYVHPDDAEALAEAFFELAGAPAAEGFEESPWAAIHTRLIAANGQSVPVVVTGAGGIGDSAVEGIIYDIRPAHEQDILRRGLTGLAHGEPIDSILGLITDMIALPPLDLDAAVLAPRGDGTYRVIGATNETFGRIMEEADDPQPWNTESTQPQRTLVSRFPRGTGEDLFTAGYREFWHMAPEAIDQQGAYRIVAAGQVIQVPNTGPIDRLSRANELAGVVLLRARADALLEHAATHDQLTQLPNRDGFYRRGVEALEASQSETAAMLFLDLDGFKQINDKHGHAAGDQVLIEVARRLVAVTRSVDMVARLGGDEFVILVGALRDRPADRSRVQVIATRALQALGRDINAGDAIAHVAASVGAAIGPATTSLDELLAHADSAMYEAKRAGGNRHHIVEI